MAQIRPGGGSRHCGHGDAHSRGGGRLSPRRMTWHSVRLVQGRTRTAWGCHACPGRLPCDVATARAPLAAHQAWPEARPPPRAALHRLCRQRWCRKEAPEQPVGHGRAAAHGRARHAQRRESTAEHQHWSRHRAAPPIPVHQPGGARHGGGACCQLPQAGRRCLVSTLSSLGRLTLHLTRHLTPLARCTPRPTPCPPAPQPCS